MNDITDATIVSETTVEKDAAPDFKALGSLVAPSATALLKSPSTTKRGAELTVIETADDREFAIGDLQDIKVATETLDAQRRKITDPMNAAVKATNDLFRPALTALKEADTILRAKVVAFNKVEAARLAEEARVAETARLEAVRKAAAEAAAIAAEAEKAARELQEKAAEAAKAGDYAAAQAIELEAATVQQVATTAVAHAETAVYAAPPPPPPIAASSGSSSRVKYKVELINLQALVEHCAAHPQMTASLLEFNQSGANQLATALKTGLKADGIRVYDATSLAISKKK